MHISEYFKSPKENFELLCSKNTLATELNAITNLIDVRYDASLSNTLLKSAPIAIKDVFAYKRTTITADSNILKRYQPCFNAAIVESIIDAGGVISCTTNTDEFCMGSTSRFGYSGHAVAPIGDRKYYAGGSSGGSAVTASIASCIASLGTDTGGSVRYPAACCGAVGYKPTYGYISRFGMIHFACSMEQIGVLSRYVENAELVASTVCKYDDRDAVSDKDAALQYHKHVFENLSNKKIGLFVGDDKQLSDVVKENFNNLSSDLKKLGASVEYIDTCKYLQHASTAYSVLSAAEACSNMALYDGIRFTPEISSDSTWNIRSSNFGQIVQSRILVGAYFISKYGCSYYDKAVALRKYLTCELESLFGNYDFVITPISLSGFGFKIDDTRSVFSKCADYYMPISNLSYTPAISIPYKLCDNMPFSINIMANKHKDADLFAIARLLESSFDVNESIFNIIDCV